MGEVECPGPFTSNALVDLREFHRIRAGCIAFVVRSASACSWHWRPKLRHVQQQARASALLSVGDGPTCTILQFDPRVESLDAKEALLRERSNHVACDVQTQKLVQDQYVVWNDVTSPFVTL